MKKSLLAFAAVACALSATAAQPAKAPAAKPAKAPAAQPAKPAAPQAQAWEDIGELRIASQKIMKPQIDLLAKYAKFPLLPMIVHEGLGGCEFSQTFGAPGQDDEIGYRIFANGNKVEGVLCWPVAQGADAWRKANPGKKKVGDAEPFFTADGRYACLAETADLAKLAAGKDFGAAGKIQKGLVSLVLRNEKFFDNIEPFIKDQAKEVAKVTGQKVELPAYHDAVCAVAKAIKSAVAKVGVSKNGLDIRMHLTARDGEAAKKTLFEQTAKIPACLKEFPTSAKEAGAEVLLEFENGKAKEGKGTDVLKAELQKVIPEYASAKDPAFAVKIGLTPTEDAKPVGHVWLFCWRKDNGFHALVRIPASDLAAIAAGMMQMQMDPTGGDPQ